METLIKTLKPDLMAHSVFTSICCRNEDDGDFSNVDQCEPSTSKRPQPPADFNQGSDLLNTVKRSRSCITRHDVSMVQDDGSVVQDDVSMDPDGVPRRNVDYSDGDAIAFLLDDGKLTNILQYPGDEGELVLKVANSNGGAAVDGTITVDTITISLEDGSGDDERPTFVEMKKGPPRVKRGRSFGSPEN